MIRRYRTSTLKNFVDAYQISLPTLKRNLQLLASKLPDGHPDKKYLQKSGKNKMLPAQVEVLIKHLGEPEIPNILYTE